MALAQKSYKTSFSRNVHQEYGQMVWPKNLTSTFDYLQIDVEKFQSVRKRQRARNSGSSTGIGGTLSSGATRYGNSKKSVVTTKTVPENTVLLPIPENIEVADSLKWTDTEVGILGRFAPELAEQFAQGGTGGITDSVQTFARVGKVGLIKGLIKKMGADPNAATANINGKIINPYVEQVFNGINLRQFNFEWKLVPRNRGEHKAIQNIIKYLRAAAMPDTSETFADGSSSSAAQALQGGVSSATSGIENTDRWLVVPKLFHLQWKQPSGTELSSLPKIKKCVCKNVSVTYTPDAVWATHLLDDNGNPAPVAYNLRMDFGETEIIKSSDVTNGY